MSVTNAEQAYTSLANSQVPAHLHDGIVDYVIFGQEPGDFLRAVLNNDLFRSVAQADAESLDGLPAVVAWIYNNAPARCHGSPENVLTWVLHNGLTPG